MPRVYYVNYVTDQYGQGVTGASVTVTPRYFATPIAMYTTATGTTRVATPLTTLGGKVEFWADDGVGYNIKFSGTGFMDYTHYWDAVSAETVNAYKTALINQLSGTFQGPNGNVVIHGTLGVGTATPGTNRVSIFGTTIMSTRDGNPVLYVNDANVAPANNARVVWQVRNISQFDIQQVDGSGAWMPGANQGDTAIRNTAPGGKMYFSGVSYQHGMTIDSSNNIGIGTATPTLRLDIIGEMVTRNAAGMIALRNLGGQPGIQFSNTSNVVDTSIRRWGAGQFFVNNEAVSGATSFGINNSNAAQARVDLMFGSSIKFQIGSNAGNDMFFYDSLRARNWFSYTQATGNIILAATPGDVTAQANNFYYLNNLGAQVRLTGGAFQQGSIIFGTAGDTNLYRGGNADRLMTDDEFWAAGNIRATGTSVSVGGANAFGHFSMNLDPNGSAQAATPYSGNAVSAQGTIIGWNRSQGGGDSSYINSKGGGNAGGHAFFQNDPDQGNVRLMWIQGRGTNAGQLQIPTQNENAGLNVAGERLYRLTGGGVLKTDSKFSAASIAMADTSSTMPVNPIEGQIWHYAEPSQNIAWQFRYRAAATPYRWEFLGGAPWSNNVPGSGTAAANSTTISANNFGTFTAPFTGIYNGIITAQASNNTAGTNTYLGFNWTNRTLGTNDAIGGMSYVANATLGLSKMIPDIGVVPAGGSITAAYLMSAGTASYGLKTMAILPSRLYG